MADQFKTRQEAAYAQLRGDILAGRLKPGAKLRFNDLYDRYDVSVGVIREALSRLLEQGLVQNAPQQGYSVTSISRNSLIQLTRARVEIETLTVRHAIAEGDVSWEANVLSTHHKLTACPVADADDPGRLSEAWAKLHEEFHHTVLAGCDNPWLIRIASELRASAELYRRWSVPLGDHSSARDIAGEHRALADAVLIRDAEAATRVLERHISLTTELLLDADVLRDDD